MDVNNKIIAITGGAQGIGKAVALHLAKMGSEVLLLDRDENALQSTQDEFQTQGFKCRSFRLDVADEESVKQAFAAINQQVSALNGIVNCAGVLRDGLFVFLRSLGQETLGKLIIPRQKLPLPL